MAEAFGFWIRKKGFQRNYSPESTYIMYINIILYIVYCVLNVNKEAIRIKQYRFFCFFDDLTDIIAIGNSDILFAKKLTEGQ